ncbi:hypothetical protein D3C80_1764470 [compost metagenome]
MAISRQFGKALACRVLLDRAIIDLAEDRTLQHGGINKGRTRMRMAIGKAAGTIFNENAPDALAGYIRQFMVIDQGDRGFLAACSVVGGGRAESERTDCERREKRLFHLSIPFGG